MTYVVIYFSNPIRKEFMLPEKDLLISVMDMNLVQNLITAVNESNLDQETKTQLRNELDRWQKALTISNEIRVTF